MQMSKGHGDLGSEELGLVLREFLDSNQMSEQLSSFDEVHQEVDSEVVLENVFHVNQEGVVNCVQDIFLELDVFHLLVFDDNIFSNTLHSVQLAGSLLLHKEDLSESTLTDKLAKLEVLKFGLNLTAREDLLATASHGLSDLLVHLVAAEFGVLLVFILCEVQVVISVSLLVSDGLLLVVVISILGGHSFLARQRLFLLLETNQIFRNQSVFGRGHS